jgi:hypothetical protein
MNYHRVFSRRENYAMTTVNSSGRFANQFIRNIFISLLAEKYGLDIEYSEQENMNKLGISLFKGKVEFSTTQSVSDDMILDMIEGKDRPTSNLTLNDSCYFQSKRHSLYLYNYLHSIQSQIRKANPFQDRYNSNNDLFIHIRLGDATQWNPGYEYYSKALSSITFDKGYISSDSLHHEICTKLQDQFNLELFDKDIPTTFQFGSTCKHIVLSHGSFSAMIGYLGFNSEVYYPSFKAIWHGDMFCIPSWHPIE